MTHTFDPFIVRQDWDEWLSVLFSRKDVVRMAATARNHYSQILVPSFVQAFMVGYGQKVQGLLERHLEGMRSVPEPDRASFPRSETGQLAWLRDLYEWRQAQGICHWLLGERAEPALFAALSVLTDATAGSSRQMIGHKVVAEPSGYLATALAANDPKLGTQFMERGSNIRPHAGTKPVVAFGVWACTVLVGGGQRDASFVVRGSRALTKTLLPTLLPNLLFVEIALWLKAVFFDSGVAPTAEQAILMAYDCMPGVERPDFLDDRLQS